VIEAKDYEEASRRVKAAENYLSAQPESTSLQAARSFISYFTKTWMGPAMWNSYSDASIRVAAEYLGTRVEDVLTTTNHLESLNNVVKNKWLKRWKRGGRRMRLDLFVLLLVTRIAPNLANERTKRANLFDMKKSLCPHLLSTTPAPPPSVLRFAFDDGNASKEVLVKAWASFCDDGLRQPRFLPDLVAFDCWSSTKDVLGEAAPRYQVRFALASNRFLDVPPGLAPSISSCSCRTFNKGPSPFCSHIGAALYWFKYRWQKGTPLLPSNQTELEGWLSKGHFPSLIFSATEEFHAPSSIPAVHSPSPDSEDVIHDTWQSVQSGDSDDLEVESDFDEDVNSFEEEVDHEFLEYLTQLNTESRQVQEETQAREAHSTLGKVLKTTSRDFGRLGDFARDFPHRKEDLRQIYKQLLPIQETIALLGRLAFAEEEENESLAIKSTSPIFSTSPASPNPSTAPLFRSASPASSSNSPSSPDCDLVRVPFRNITNRTRKRYKGRDVLPVSPDKGSQKRHLGTSTV
ncbi:hypothetical protein JCM5350_000275, partial [Sporobolomyces pararoseus]